MLKGLKTFAAILTVVQVPAPDTWSWHDKVAWGAGLALLGVGVITLWWFIIQTIATRKAAEAALLNARAVINSQRPWIAVRRKEPSISDSFVFEAVCISGIPAKIIQSYVDWQAVDVGKPLQPSYETKMLQYPFMLAQPDGARRIGDFGIDTLKANAPLWQQIQALEKSLYFLGKVEYVDAISVESDGKPIVHETTWCYEYIGGSITRSGPTAQFNDYR